MFKMFRINPERINVDSIDGIVTLRGNVRDYFEKRSAEAACLRVSGVRAVADELEVDLLGIYKINDEDVAKAAAMALEWNYSVPPTIQAAVDDGMVTLKGEAQWDFQRVAAQKAVSHIKGVRGVVVKMTIKIAAQPSGIKSRIRAALKRSALDEGRQIDVRVDGDRVTLSGNVPSVSEIGDAGVAAWNSPGVRIVKNDLTLTN